MNTRLGFAQAAIAVATLSVTLAGCNKPATTSPAPGSSATSAPAAEANASSASGSNVADGDVTTNVKTALLKDDRLKAFDIGVDTQKGDVRLSGTVDSQAQVDEVIKLARATDGVHSIHDELTVRK